MFGLDHDEVAGIIIMWFSLAFLLAWAIHQAKRNLRKRRAYRALMNDPFFSKIEEYRNGIA